MTYESLWNECRPMAGSTGAGDLNGFDIVVVIVVVVVVVYCSFLQKSYLAPRPKARNCSARCFSSESPKPVPLIFLSRSQMN